MTRDGVDITEYASRGPKTKEQRDHAALMRKLKACGPCKRSKQRCDPSHHGINVVSPTTTASTPSSGTPSLSSSSLSHSRNSRSSISPQILPEDSFSQSPVQKASTVAFAGGEFDGAQPSFSPSFSPPDILFDASIPDMDFNSISFPDLDSQFFDLAENNFIFSQSQFTKQNEFPDYHGRNNAVSSMFSVSYSQSDFLADQDWSAHAHPVTDQWSSPLPNVATQSPVLADMSDYVLYPESPRDGHTSAAVDLSLSDDSPIAKSMAFNFDGSYFRRRSSTSLESSSLSGDEPKHQSCVSTGQDDIDSRPMPPRLSHVPAGGLLSRHCSEYNDHSSTQLPLFITSQMVALQVASNDLWLAHRLAARLESRSHGAIVECSPIPSSSPREGLSKIMNIEASDDQCNHYGTSAHVLQSEVPHSENGNNRIGGVIQIENQLFGSDSHPKQHFPRQNSTRPQNVHHNSQDMNSVDFAVLHDDDLFVLNRNTLPYRSESLQVAPVNQSSSQFNNNPDVVVTQGVMSQPFHDGNYSSLEWEGYESQLQIEQPVRSLFVSHMKPVGHGDLESTFHFSELVNVPMPDSLESVVVASSSLLNQAVALITLTLILSLSVVDNCRRIMFSSFMMYSAMIALTNATMIFYPQLLIPLILISTKALDSWPNMTEVKYSSIADTELSNLQGIQESQSDICSSAMPSQSSYSAPCSHSQTLSHTPSLLGHLRSFTNIIKRRLGGSHFREQAFGLSGWQSS